MKSFRKLLLLMICIVPCALFFSACKEEPKEPIVTSIKVELINTNYTLDKIQSDPSIYGYIYTIYGKNFDLSSNDFKVTANLDDATTKTLTSSEYQFETTIPTDEITPVGSYTLSFKYSNLPELQIKVVIDKAQLSVTNCIWNYIYPFTYNGLEQTVSISNVPENVNVSLTGTTTAKNAGKYTAIATFSPKDSNNYVCNQSLTLNWEIQKAELTITANNSSITYGQNATNNGCAFSGFVAEEDSSVLNGDLNYTYQDYTSASNVGSYDIVPSGLTAENYDINYVNGTLTVNKAIIDTSSINSTTIRLLEDEFDYTGEPITVALQNYSLPAGVRLASFTNNTKTEVNSYTAIATFECSDTRNYESFAPIQINLDWTIQAKAQVTPVATLPSDLEISISGYTLYLNDFIDYSGCYLAYFDFANSDMFVTSDNCPITLNTSSNIVACDENGTELILNEESCVYYSYQADLCAYASKIVVTVEQTEFVIYVVFADSGIII